MICQNVLDIIHTFCDIILSKTFLAMKNDSAVTVGETKTINDHDHEFLSPDLGTNPIIKQ